jgi:hypothetical protein
VKGIVSFQPLAFIPCALVDGYHTPPLAGEAVIREIVGRVGENKVYALCRDFGQNI